MTYRENLLLWAGTVIGIGVGLWLGSWLALWKPFALFIVSYPIMLIGMHLLSNVNWKAPK